MAQVDCSEVLRVLSNPTRMQVVRTLLQNGPMHVGDVNSRLEVEPTLLSHHLRVLREAGLVEAERDGKAVLYRLAPGIRAGRNRALNLSCCRLSFTAEP
jgi:DNA-binding transcriptional ArsR family regulator